MAISYNKLWKLLVDRKMSKDDLQMADDIQKRLKEIRNAVLEMTVVKIVSNSEEDSYTIFEILNARGQELAAHELLKNYIMRYIQPVERRDDAKAMWEDMERTVGSSMDKFIKHYATHRFGDTRDKYNSPYQAIQKATRGQRIGELFDDIKLKSEYYSRIIHPVEGEDGNCSTVEYSVKIIVISRMMSKYHEHIWAREVSKDRLSLWCLWQYVIPNYTLDFAGIIGYNSA